MITAVLAAVGTLLGSIVTGTFQHLAAGRAERAASAEQLRRDRLEAVTALASAGSDHRRALRSSLLRRTSHGTHTTGSSMRQPPTSAPAPDGWSTRQCLMALARDGGSLAVSGMSRAWCVGMN
ncbi:hypothetical protein ACFWIA_21900 [Streptomyces sp. NPDC127068]|uniref:hypothetical protein n=1 Tax=Streptomyces sp. NPDC127068 TaxID=3347127 RepID=UPI00366013A8